MSETLPKGWIISSLGKVSTHPQYGWTCSSNKKGAIKLLRTTDISNGKINWEQVPFCGKEPQNVDKYILKVNDILVSRAGSVGISYKISEEDLVHRTIFASYLIRFCPYNPASFVAYYFKSHQYWQFISDTQLGIAVPNVNATKLSKLPIPLPPLNEQKRIVAKLDAIIPRIDLLKTRLDKIPTLIKRFRQSVLTAAVTGKLTETWRDAHPEVESVEISVKTIYKRRIKECKTISKKEKIEGFFSEIEAEDSNILPETWRFIFLNKICESFQYGTSSKSEKTGKVAVLRMGNLQNGKIDWSDLAYTSSEKEIKKYKLKKNAVLFNRTNSPELVGKTSIYLGEQDAIFAGYLIKINNFEILDPHYLNFALNTNYAKAFCNREKTDGVSQSNINAQKLGRFEIPLPPLEEQKEIVRQVVKLFALADKLETHCQNAKTRIDKLSQSVLAKAFRGELVPQNPNDEPAEKLLDRIMEEKAKMEEALKRVKKKGAGQKEKAGSRK